MLKRINLEDVRLGMYIEKLEGSWFKHPFWKTRFVLEDPVRLADLQASDLDGVIIDTAKGLDVAARQAPSPPVATAPALRPARAFGNCAPKSVRPLPPAPIAPLRSAHHASTRREFGNARRVAGQCEKAVSRVFLESRLGKAIDPSSVEPIVEEVFASIQKDPHAFNGLMRCKHGAPTIYRHAVSVSALMISLAMRMKFHPPEVKIAGLAGLLLDIGMAHVEGAGTGGRPDCDNQSLRRHIVVGHEILSASNDTPDEVLRVCLYHHERLDGSGFPLGLRGDKIDVYSRMAAVCDTFDDLISIDAGGAGLDPARAIQAMVDDEAKFDPDILNAFIDSVGTFPVGSIVEMRSRQLAMVVFSDPDGGHLPTVRTFYCLARGKAVRGETIDLRNCFGRDAIVGTSSIAGLGIRGADTLAERLITAAMRDDF